MVLNAGACAVGFATATTVDDEAELRYSRWIGDCRHASMSYMERYTDVRHDPRLLLDGAATLIVAAFNYTPAHRQRAGVPRIADYALGRDYHEVVRTRLNDVAQQIAANYGGECRVCVDTAPLRERYWATRAGLGFIGLNNLLIIPGIGTRTFIGTIIWTGEVEADEPCTATCMRCGACLRACPGKALSGDGSAVDARRCLSYLTIEHRGDLPADFHTGGRLYGCDSCQDVCPYNLQHPIATEIDEFAPSEAVMSLTAEQVESMDATTFAATFRHSAVKRTKLAGLQRNLRHL
jgi:epoxyqueuosine reductase